MDKTLAEAFPPGEYLSDELEARHWSQAEFAEILGRPTQFVSEIIAGKKEITRESAAQIGAALETSAEMWLNLQNSYLLWKQSQNDVTQRQLSDVRRRARLNGYAPITLLVKRGLLSGGSLDELEQQLMELLELGSLEEIPMFVLAARRSNTEVDITPLQSAWLGSARHAARSIAVQKYDQSGLEKLAAALAQKVREPEAFEFLPTDFANVGVRLVYLEAFPGSKMNGATFLLDDDLNKPVIALSGLGKRLDKVLFTLLHEIAHLVRGDVQPDAPLFDEDVHTLGDETEADKLAHFWAIPGGLPTAPKPVRQQWITNEAARLGINPIVVIGRLQNRNDLDWRTQLVKNAPTVNGEMAKWGDARNFGIVA